jgi:hypothetical protein
MPAVRSRMWSQKKSSLVGTVFSPHSKLVAGCESVARCGGSKAATRAGGALTGNGQGERLSEWPGDGAQVAAIVHGKNLQPEFGSLPIENSFGNQVDTI